MDVFLFFFLRLALDIQIHLEQENILNDLEALEKKKEQGLC